MLHVDEVIVVRNVLSLRLPPLKLQPYGGIEMCIIITIIIIITLSSKALCF